MQFADHGHPFYNSCSSMCKKRANEEKSRRKYTPMKEFLLLKINYHNQEPYPLHNMKAPPERSEEALLIK